MTIDKPVHRQLAVELFNQTWSLLDKPDRTLAETDAMIHGAHASRYHWGLVGDATNLSIGEWQISRVYAVLRRAEPALYHAQRCLEISEQSAVAPFFLAYAHEAIARSLALSQDAGAAQHLAKARALADMVTEEDDRKLLLGDLETIAIA